MGRRDLLETLEVLGVTRVIECRFAGVDDVAEGAAIGARGEGETAAGMVGRHGDDVAAGEPEAVAGVHDLQAQIQFGEMLG
jgi:hypothetical protein